MADPLTMLRDVLSKQQQPVIEGDEYVFGKTRFNKNVPTAFKSSANNTYYTLQAVHLCHLNRDVSRGVYVLQVARAGTTAVSLNDRKELLAYLDGEVDTSSSIVYDSSLMSGSSSSAVSTGTQQSMDSSLTSQSDAMQVDDSNNQYSTGTQQQSMYDASGASLGDQYKIGGDHDYQYDASYRSSHIPEIDLTDEMISEKSAFTSHLLAVPSKPNESYSLKDSENQFMEDIGNKRKALSMEKSNFMMADEPITKMILQREKTTNDRTSILNGPTAYLDILDKYNQFKKEEKRPSSSSSIPGSSSKPHPTSGGANNKSSMTSTLHDSASIGSNRKLSSDNQITYEVYDNIKLLKAEDWPRVAAVFVQGEAWQFKDWKWPTPVDILSNIKGFYLKLDDTTVPESVKSWDVKILHISRQKRHLDLTGQIEFWKAFDEYILTRKPFLNH
ncbi:hypothetical protein PPL_00382 [Heterostelium album PN500]|uniref:Uncharacterized protein n=1 Tax=Heterostelium pallidum (strain ATCC 26659 / Pp 5 / PN500) TaxID=670386 RepID=D3AWA8_HETP5|nr:hypothetical protein PPL_00382 [Heterostelium album PN500]EFA86581.1 hypothetical protein PPL_00382 [Heterostelium album PN500]|eukprot:XP_020438686.1 hypothetical protein PPL_00382 [Heterostelium album PN500]